MKFYLSLVLITFLHANLFAQKVPSIEVKETKAVLNKDTRNAFTVLVYHRDQRKLEKELKKVFKDKGAKVDMGKEIFADNASFSSFGNNNTVDVYAKVESKDEFTFVISAAVDLGGAWLSSSNSDQKEQSNAFKSFLREFAVNMSKNTVKEEVDQATKELSEKEKELKDLASDKKDLEKDTERRKEDIEEAKRKIEENKKALEQNGKDQAAKKTEIETQGKVVKELELKEQAVK